VGVSRRGNQQDSIFNGARDNAIGVTGLLATARYLSTYRPKRSVLFIAFTAEEKGLLGSRYYAQNPVIPLNQCIFNFNCDGAGYNNTTIATVIGMERTTAEGILAKACEAFGLKAAIDPVPEQNLFERSDNLHFAEKGIPAITFAPGITAFDAEVNKYYHQPADEVNSLDFDYLLKYFRAYVYANVLLANAPQPPVWKPGDKFEVAAKKLYGK
jgi:Zn-dependent M28 family amino/carboxypeptidase